MQEYRPRKQDLLVSQILRATKDVRSVIISGPPGVGKTSFTRWFAREVGAVEVYFLAHHWVSEEDLFVKLDPARVAALAGGIGQNLCIDDAYRPGVLLRASLLSQKEKVVLILDEWDKSPDRCDALLLEFLQQGRIVGPFGEEFQACLENLFVFITTNGMRQLSEPLLRRCLRYDMSFLPPETEADVIRRKTGVPITVARLIVAMLNTIRSDGVTAPSLQEGIRLAESLRVCQSAEDAEFCIRGWLVKEDEDWQALLNKFRNPASILFGEYRRCK